MAHDKEGEEEEVLKQLRGVELSPPPVYFLDNTRSEG